MTGSDAESSQRDCPAGFLRRSEGGNWVSEANTSWGVKEDIAVNLLAVGFYRRFRDDPNSPYRKCGTLH
jgi:hypothetical protein